MRQLIKVLIIVILLFIPFSKVNAKLLHGSLNTTWNGSLFGGGWVCFNSLVTGCSQAFNAVCSPSGASGDDLAAMNSFNTFFAAASTPVKLYIAPGSVCHTEGATNNIGALGIVPLTIWAFGAKLSNQNIGGADFIQDAVHNSKIVTVSAGTNIVTLVTPSEITRFSNGDQALVSGISTQNDGYPPNFQLAEYKVITAITTNCPSPCTSSIITLDTKLTNSYKSTWPDLGLQHGAPTPLGGPGMIYSLNPQFGINLQVYGLTLLIDASPLVGSNVVNKNIYFYGVNHEGAGWGFRGQNITLVNTVIPGGTEFDKDISSITCINCYGIGNGLFFQSASPKNMSITNSSSNGTLNGTGQNTIVTNSNFAVIAAGVAGFGAASNLTLNGVTYPSVHTYYHSIPTTDLTFSLGTFTILKSATTISNAYSTFIPGFKYYLGGVAGNSVCSPQAEFTVTDLREDATHVFIDIDQSTLPACGGGLGSVLSYGQFHALTATQTNSGPASIFVDPEMIP